MATYKQIFGKQVKFLSSDPANQAEGQIWYNSTSGTFKSVLVSDAWASTSPMTTARGFVAHTGTQTASLLCGGLQEPPTTYHSATEEYNGSGWATGGAIPAALYALASAGTQTAGLVFGGANSSDAKQSTTATYNGTAWSTTPNSLNTARDMLSGGGTQTAALAVGGRAAPSAAMTTNFEEWNGSSWTALTAIPEKRGYTHANGPETAFFLASGATGDNAGAPYTTATLNYDGSSISTGANVNTARAAGGAAGDSANAIFFGGDIGGTAQVKTEKYDGTSWSEVGDMASAKKGAGSGAGTSNTAAIAAGNYGAPSTANAEEFNTSANVITAAAWASATAMGTARRNPAQGVGPPTAAMVTGGINGASAVGQTEQYNGSSWTEVADLNTARQCMGSGNAGSQTAAIVFGGSTSEPMPGGLTDATEEFNGTSWTTTPNAMIAGRFQLGGCGTTAAALAFGGDPGTVDSSEEWDGTSWTEGSNLNTARQQVQGCGTQTAGLGVGGYSGGWLNNTEEYNGASWTVGGANLVSVGSMGMAGIQTAALSFGGSPGNPAITTGYDGAAWSTRPSLGTGVDFNGGAGSSTAALSFGGNSPSPPTDNGITTVEEFTGETSTVNYKTITTS